MADRRLSVAFLSLRRISRHNLIFRLPGGVRPRRCCNILRAAIAIASDKRRRASAGHAAGTVFFRTTTAERLVSDSPRVVSIRPLPCIGAFRRSLGAVLIPRLSVSLATDRSACAERQLTGAP